MPVVLLVGGRADESRVAGLEVGLQHVRGVHRALAGGAGAHQCVNLVDVDDVVLRLLADAVHDDLDAVLEVAAVLRAGQQRAHVEQVDAAALQALGHVAALDAAHQPPDECRLAHARLADVQRVVLLAAAEHLNGALQLLVAADERVVALYVVVHAGDEPSPRLWLFGVVVVVELSELLVQVVVEVDEVDEVAHEVALLVAEGALQQVAGPRVVQAEQPRHEVWRVECRRAAVVHLLAGRRQQLLHLGRERQGVVIVAGHRLYGRQPLLDLLFELLWLVEDVQGRVEVAVVDEGQQQVFGHDELMAVLRAALHGAIQHP